MASNAKYVKKECRCNELCIKYKINKSLFYKIVKYRAKHVGPIKSHSEADFLSRFKLNCYRLQKNGDYVSLKFEEKIINEFKPAFINSIPSYDRRRNDDQVSLKPDEDVFNKQLSKIPTLLHQSIKPLALHGTLSVVDAEGKVRFPQSFSVNLLEDRTDKKEFGLDQYIKRSTLLKSDVFIGNYLFVQCELVYQSEEGNWTLQFSYGHNFLYIRYKNDSLWEILSNKSPFFKKIIDAGVTKLHFLSHDDFSALGNLTTSIKMDSDIIFNDVNDVFDLYMFADYVLLFEYKQKCSDFLKANMQDDFVFSVIAMADLCNDCDLKKYAFDYALKYWNSKDISKNFAIFKGNHPETEKYLSIKMVAEEMEDLLQRRSLFQENEENPTENMFAEANEERPSRNISTQSTTKEVSLTNSFETEPDRYYEFYQ